METTTLAVDLAKDVFQVACANRVGRIHTRRRLTRRQFAELLANAQAGTEVVMEACGSAHYWARQAQAHGLRVRLLPVQYVRPYVRRNKTDRADSEAILEAARCGEIRPVPVKTVEQQALQGLHRLRSQWQTTRVARINGLRGLLREHGYAIPVGAKTGLRCMAAILAEDESPLPGLLRHALRRVVEEVQALEAQIAAVDRQLTEVAATHPVGRRLQTIPGVGVLTATALVGSVPHIHGFRRGREFASWLGLTPREYASGQRRYVGRISKRGDVHLRWLLAQGGRAVLRVALRTAPERRTHLQQWALQLAVRRGRNKAAIAVANKLARIVWAVWQRDEVFHAAPAAA